MLLVGDIGGTHTRFALSQGGRILQSRRYPSSKVSALEPLLDAFLLEVGAPQIQAACLGVAGRVQRGQVLLTNLGWRLDEEGLSQYLKVPLRLINDFHAQALAIPQLKEGEFEQLCGEQEELSQPAAILGAGTGLGEAILLPPSAQERVISSEGGHCRFAPRDEQEIDLLRFLQRRYPEHVSVERLLSGAGLVAIYDFLRGEALRPPALQLEDPAPLISQYALSKADPSAVEALKIFIHIYADEAAHLALKCNAGAVYLTGGISPQILPALREEFSSAFIAKGRYRDLLSKIPVRVVLHPAPGLLGAAAQAKQLLRGS